MFFRNLVLLLVALVASAELVELIVDGDNVETVIKNDEPAKMASRDIVELILNDGDNVETIIKNDEPPTKMVSNEEVERMEYLCADGTSYSCFSNSSVCTPGSAVYCDFSVDLVKKIMKGHDTEISALSRKLSALETQYTKAQAHNDRLQSSIQYELQRASNRVFLMKPRLLKGHYLATDNAIILIALCASFGVRTRMHIPDPPNAS